MANLEKTTLQLQRLCRCYWTKGSSLRHLRAETSTNVTLVKILRMRAARCLFRGHIRHCYGVYAYENEKTRNRILIEKGGKLRVTTDNAELQEEERLRIYEVKMVRKERLKQLYKTEFAGWQQQLGKRGLAVEIHYD